MQCSLGFEMDKITGEKKFLDISFLSRDQSKLRLKFPITMDMSYDPSAFSFKWFASAWKVVEEFSRRLPRSLQFAFPADLRKMGLHMRLNVISWLTSLQIQFDV